MVSFGHLIVDLMAMHMAMVMTMAMVDAGNAANIGKQTIIIVNK